MYSHGNNKWNRKEVELAKENLLKELKEEKSGWTNIYRSEELYSFVPKERIILVHSPNTKGD